MRRGDSDACSECDMVSPEDILDQATSRDGFLRFVDALVIEF